jgi:hypothetical protein
MRATTSPNWHPRPFSSAGGWHHHVKLFCWSTVITCETSATAHQGSLHECQGGLCLMAVCCIRVGQYQEQRTKPSFTALRVGHNRGSNWLSCLQHLQPKQCIMHQGNMPNVKQTQTLGGSTISFIMAASTRQLASPLLNHALGAQTVVVYGMKHNPLLVCPLWAQPSSINANPRTNTSLTQIPGHIPWCGHTIWSCYPYLLQWHQTSHCKNGSDKLIKVDPHPDEVGWFNTYDNQLATAGKARQARKDVQRTWWPLPHSCAAATTKREFA